MATAQLIEGFDPSSVEASARAEARSRAAWLPLALAGALLVVVLYAAFEHGGVALPAGTRVEVAIAVIAAVAALAWLGLDALTCATSRSALAGLALLAGLAGRCGLTLLWSVAP